jgi:hypothetical protein
MKWQASAATGTSDDVGGDQEGRDGMAIMLLYPPAPELRRALAGSVDWPGRLFACR